MNKVISNVEKLKEKYFTMWSDTDIDISSLKQYSISEKNAIQKQINITLDALLSQIKKAPADKNKRGEWQETLKKILTQRAKLFLNIKNKKFEKIMINSFTDVAETFINSAKSFDSSCKTADIYQAIRNVWIMNTIQAIANVKIEHTPSVFAYSMLYPYTDNFLDNPKVTNQEKKNFNNRLHLRLEGNDIKPKNIHEKRIYSLISMIESQYSREKYPHVFESIICIHTGQCKSLEQQNNVSSAKENDILMISIEKGGTSVLADAYLVCGDLDEKLFDLMFGFGFTLQLIDDLQDTLEDYKNNHMTIFSSKSSIEKLDNLTSKLITFIIKTLDFENYDKSPYIVDIKELIIHNTLLLVFEAIWENRKLYTKKYIKNYKKFTPFNYKYLHRKINKAKSELSKLEAYF